MSREMARKIADRVLELESKIKTIKSHMRTWRSGHSDWQRGYMSAWKKKLDEILEDQSSGDNAVQNANGSTKT